MASSLNIPLPASLKSWQQASSWGSSTSGQFVRELRRERASAKVDEHLLHSLESGPARAMDRKVWNRIRAEGKAVARRQNGK